MFSFNWKLSKECYFELPAVKWWKPSFLNCTSAKNFYVFKFYRKSLLSFVKTNRSIEGWYLIPELWVNWNMAKQLWSVGNVENFINKINVSSASTYRVNCTINSTGWPYRLAFWKFSSTGARSIDFFSMYVVRKVGWHRMASSISSDVQVFLWNVSSRLKLPERRTSKASLP